MATYKGIQGLRIQTRTSDPTTATVGEIYYNFTTGQFRVIKSGGTISTITIS